MATTNLKFEETTTGKVYRAKVTGRHAITLPAELCRELGVEVGDSVEFEVKEDGTRVRRVAPAPVVPISSLRGIFKSYFPDSQSIRDFLEEERAGWDEREAFLDKIRNGEWDRYDDSSN